MKKLIEPSRKKKRTSSPIINVRIPRADQLLINQAAELSGNSKSQFIREAALERAHLVLSEHNPKPVS